MIRRTYDAVAKSRLTADWGISTGSRPKDDLRDLRTLIAIGRMLARDNDSIRRYLQQLEQNVIGPQGIQLMCKVKSTRGRLNTRLNDDVERRFRAWCKQPTVCGRFSFRSLLCNIIREVPRDGAAVLIAHTAGGKLQYQRVPVDYIDLDYTVEQTAFGQPYITQGIEVDSTGRPIRYHFRPPGNAKRFTYSADRVIHIRLVDDCDSYHSAPWVVPSSIKLKLLSAATEAEVVAWRTAACKMGFYIPGEDAEYEGDGYTDDGDPINEAAPGIFEKLKRGWDFQSWDPAHPQSTIPEFSRTLLQGVSASLNMSYSRLSNDITRMSFSSLRFDEINDQDMFEFLQTMIIEQVCGPVFRTWAALEYPENVAESITDSISWRARKWKLVRPTEQVAATVEKIKNGLQAVDEAVAEYDGDVNNIAAVADRIAELYKNIDVVNPYHEGNQTVQSE